MKFFGNPVFFVIAYILLMLPTYALAFLGSNSVVVGAIAGGMTPMFLLHIALLTILVVVTWFRGSFIDKKWLVIFPIMATVFDMVPGLNLIPLIPTFMHLLAIILGVALTKTTAPTTQAQ